MANASLAHPGADWLASYRLGWLRADDMAVVENHLADCAACRALLDSLSQETLTALAKSSTAVLKAGGEVRPAAADPTEPLPARIGPYRVERLLGRGGMGSVYLARDERLGRAVAVKVPRLSPGEGRETAERFRREARAAATIEHPNICPVYDVGEDAGAPYLAMRYVEGKPLSAILRSGRPLPPPAAAALAGKVALALHAAHEKGVVHRDLKPANIMLAGGREPIVMDFGLARQLNQGDTRLTQSGVILGTPAFMSPEQVAADAAAIGSATDVYSLGVILYELLTGRLPFDGPVTAVLGQILTADPPSPLVHRPGLNAQLVAIVQKAMARKPADRFPSMAQMAAALSAYLRAAGQGQPVSPPEPGLPPPSLTSPDYGRQASQPTHPPAPPQVSGDASGVPPEWPDPARRKRPNPLLLALTVSTVVVATPFIIVLIASRKDTPTVKQETSIKAWSADDRAAQDWRPGHSLPRGPAPSDRNPPVQPPATAHRSDPAPSDQSEGRLGLMKPEARLPPPPELPGEPTDPSGIVPLPSLELEPPSHADDPEVRDCIAKLRSKNTDARVDAAKRLAAMGARGKPASRALCHAMLPELNPNRLRLAARSALQAVNLEVYEPVVAIIFDKEPRAKARAIGRLEAMGPQAAGPAVPVLKECWRQFPGMLDSLRALVLIAPMEEAVGDLVGNCLGHPTPEFRAFAAQAVPKVAGRTKWVNRLAELCRNQPPLVRRAAAFALGEMGRDARKAVRALERLATDEDAAVRDEADRALRKISADG